MCESLLRLPRETWPMLRVMVHDEIVLSVPERDLRDVAVAVKQAMTWQLDDDLPVLCDMAAGRNWGEVSAK
jgi:DNA polymerase I-like protein with 3'-5' exonuclease and polymerase domains